MRGRGMRSTGMPIRRALQPEAAKLARERTLAFLKGEHCVSECGALRVRWGGRHACYP